MENRLIDDLQHLVCGSLATLPDAAQFWQQRIGGHTGHRLRPLQFCFQQLTVSLVFGGLLHNLLQHSIFRFRQVFLLRLGHFLPKGTVRLSKYEKRHAQCN